MKNVIIMSVASLATSLYVLEASIYMPAFVAIQEDLKTDDVMMNLTVTVYSLSSAVAPILRASFSDCYGRRPIYLLSNLLCFVAAILIWLRLLQGAGTSASFSVLAGTISDLYPIEQRGRAGGYSSFGTVLGAVVGPGVGGIIASIWGWRHISSATALVTGVEIVLIYFLIPETLHRPPTKDQIGARTPTSALKSPAARSILVVPTVLERILHVAQSFKVLRYPFILTILFSFTASFMGIQSNQSRVYNLDTNSLGLWALVFAVSNVFGSILSASKHGVPWPEDRLYQTAYGQVIYAAGLLSIGWMFNFAVDYRVANSVGFIILGFGGAMSLNPPGTYIIDIFPADAAMVSSIIYMVRNLLASYTPVVVPLIEDKAGLACNTPLGL
ncbi:MFS general substrate transporter [Gonapodya prolifera JEL478]|uniref:MFS general substrate transporter n=1 Tax=Gonapodya prolifera (strain JEL478) TaxID=1344416 RepID=A0A139B0G1_GONPJ|nr:MFS general substrate transporter [Gonapodya prolifera JEL478]|eukprot:KXS22481.1 MFS general substrate transporter [Gonapodya prolifera JEL478]